ncbi:short-chain dehydrogenase/reductase [Oxalicibacterium flavum]|uniref:Short-chain dehydrogenase/reductase n=1 Tax=Oxalicibacterium flavum TaxID=179467 RepID=A0A8J2UNP4_9BURK|nr:SDR family oxidoreductase [Oxalicibacterium flavum]GGC14585.1 short-chain dehydrogenase/reductase [Oxalicibacterium flavum]
MNDQSSFNPFSLSGKRILVTGATSGLGLEIAQSCAKMGAELIITGRDTERLAGSLDALRTISDLPHTAFQADLTDSAQRAALVASLDQQMHGLVHSAGISRLCPVRMMSEAHLREVQSINVDSPMLLTQALLKRNLIAADGSILFIASIAAHIGVAGVGAYSGTKAALLAIARCLAVEVAKRGIRVNCLSPSLVQTPLFDAAMLAAGSDSMEAQRANHPLGFGTPADVANAAIFMLSGASRWITGTTLVMDGGLTIN